MPGFLTGANPILFYLSLGLVVGAVALYGVSTLLLLVIKERRVASLVEQMECHDPRPYRTSYFEQKAALERERKASSIVEGKIWAPILATALVSGGLMLAGFTGLIVYLVQRFGLV